MQAYNKRKVQLIVVKKITVSLCILTEINKYFFERRHKSQLNSVVKTCVNFILIKQVQTTAKKL